MSLTLHEQLAASGVKTGLARRGVLNVYAGEEAFAEARREADESRAHGLQAEVLDGAGALEEVPSLAGSFAGAVYHPGDAHCDPLQFVRAVGEAAKETGASLRTGVEVLRLRRQGGRVVSVATTTGDLLAGEVVLAAGAWTPSLTRELGLVLPVEGGKGYHIDLEAGTGDPTIPVWFQESRVIVTPLPGRVRLAGTLELAGLDLSVNRRRVAAVERAGRRGLHGLEARKTLEVWRGLRPCSPDGLPIIGRADGLANVVLATGHGMMGLTLAPITGRLVAEISMGVPPSHGLGPVSPARFRSFLGL
jgi:D-amino-acid dehydrogenase